MKTISNHQDDFIEFSRAFQFFETETEVSDEEGVDNSEDLCQDFQRFCCGHGQDSEDTTDVKSRKSDDSTGSDSSSSIFDGSYESDLSDLKSSHRERMRNTLGKLMGMVGLDEVKALFLRIKACVEVSRRQGVDLSDEDFDVDFVGNKGTGTLSLRLQQIPHFHLVSFQLTRIGKTTISKLYEEFLVGLGVYSTILGPVFTPPMFGSYRSDPRPSAPLTIGIKDYSDEELLKILVKRIQKKYGGRMRVHGGLRGLYSRILVRRVGRGRGGESFGNLWDLKDAFFRVCCRQAERLQQERRSGKEPDDYLFTKEDMIGPRPADVAEKSVAWKELQAMVGLDEVKASLRTLFNHVHTNYHRELQEKELVQVTLNRVFLGPPGTGKTTVARLYARVLADIGLVSGGEILTATPSDLIGNVIGASEDKTQNLVRRAEGKVLIIDDAHMLYNGDQSDELRSSDDYRVAAIDTLVAEVTNIPGEDRCIILVGYTEQMEEMFQNSNPGLARRFPLEDAFRFQDFDNVKLNQILNLKLKVQELQISPGGREVALEILDRARGRPNFGNGGAVENLLSQAKTAYQKALPKMETSEVPETIVLEPVHFDANYDRALRPGKNHELLFGDLIGFDEISAQFEGYQRTVAGMRRHGIDPRPYVPFTFLFKGPPGTGKTTMARKVGQIFYDMGFLSHPEVIECSVSDLIGRYTGQTGPKVIKLFERALGKVLFIDEAYRLTTGEGRGGSYTREAVGELVDCLTKKRFERKFVIVLAGYEEEINKLMHSNRGLRSRFATDVIFPRMSPEHSLRLLERNIGKVGIGIGGLDGQHDSMRKPIVELFAKLTRATLWANARDVETLGSAIITHVFQRQGDPSSAGPLVFAGNEVVELLESKLQELEIAVLDMALCATPKDHSQLAATLANLGSSLFRRYEKKGSIDDLEAAVSNLQQAVAAMPEDHPERIGWMHYLGSVLSSRYDRMGDPDDLEAAIIYTERAISGTSENHSNWAEWLYNLSNRFSIRYKRTGNLGDIEKAIATAKTALSAMVEDHPKWSDMTMNLSYMLSDRYQRIGNLADLENAIANVRKIIFSMSEDAEWTPLSYLGCLLTARYERTGNTSDLDTAVWSIKQALSSIPEGHSTRPVIMDDLGSALWHRHERTGSSDDLEAAIYHSEQAVSAISQDHNHLTKMLNNFSNRLFSRYQLSGKMDDLHRSIQKLQHAISTTPEEESYRVGMMGNLAGKLATRYERTGDMADLEDAISSAQKAVSSIPKERPDWADSLSNLSNMLLERFKATGEIEDARNALNGYETAAQCSNAIPLVRVSSARHALQILKGLQMWERGSQLSQKAVDLLPKVCGRWLNWQDQQYAMLQTSGLAADACSFSLRAGHVEQALRQVEFGRGVILGYLIDTRSDVSVLRQSHPDLAEELERLRLIASRPISNRETPAVRERMIQDRNEAAGRLDDCLDRIRKKENFDRFFLPPEVDSLIQGAEEGPIVIVNVTDISSDAIIISRDGIKAIELPAMTSATTSLLVQDLKRYRSVIETHRYYGRDIIVDTCEETRYSSTFLSWLWSSCVAPVLYELAKLPEFIDSTAVPRVWWIGTGVASCLPFHAASKYPDSPESPQEDALHRMISSYTPTIKSLIHARTRAVRMERDTKAAVLVVTMSETPGQQSLPGVAKERLAVEQALEDTFTVKVLEQPSVSEVLKGMENSDIVHFACHGSSDRIDPSRSHLLLQGTMLPETSDIAQLPSDERDSWMGKLTVQSISESQAFGKAQIAYLSACSTAEVKAGQFADEALHIVSAFQVAGFGHVVGSLWSADDETCAQMARFFYEHLAKDKHGITNRSVAEALRNATIRIRYDRDASLWAPYVHYGA